MKDSIIICIAEAIAGMLCIGVGTLVTIIVFSTAANFYNWLWLKHNENKVKTFKIKYMSSCTWSGIGNTLATYDIAEARECYVKARRHEQAIAKLFKNKHLIDHILILDVSRIEPDS